MDRRQTNRDKPKSNRGNRDRNRPGSTTSLGKRRSLRASKSSGQQQQQQQQQENNQDDTNRHRSPSSSISNPRTSDYGSQASPMRLPAKSDEIIKVAILGAAGGIGQPLAMLLMLHSEYVQHLALYDLVHVRGVGADLSHIDRQCKVTTHLGPDELADAVRGAKVIVIPAGLAQKPGMSRDDLFGSNAKIMLNLAKVCATVAPQAMLAIISNPVNSLVPLTCEVYHRILTQQQQQQQPSGKTGGTAPTAGGPNSPGQAASSPQQQQQQQQQMAPEQPLGSQQHENMADGQPDGSASQAQARKSEGKQQQQQQQSTAGSQFHDSFRRIFGVTTLDVVRASTIAAKSALFKQEPNGLFRDPAKIQIPVVGGHAGKTIIPLLSQATPRLDRRRLSEDKSTVHLVIESVQQAGIDVLNAKKGAGSATLAMAYAACRFTISLLRAQQGETNIVECAYVRQREQIVPDLDYFSTPLLIGKDGYVKSLGLINHVPPYQAAPAAASSKQSLLPFEQQMIEDGARELRLSVAKGEDFAKEHLSHEQR